MTETGTSLLLTQEVLEGQDVEVELHGVGRNKPIKLPAVVRWAEIDENSGTFFVGVQFRGRIPYADMAALV